MTNIYIDLHIHTNASDGKYTPEEIVSLISKQPNLAAVSIVDHNTVVNVQTVRRLMQEAGLDVEVISGIEVSIQDEPERDIIGLHFLGYFFDESHPSISHLVEKQAETRGERAYTAIKKLNELGFTITFEDVLEEMGNGVVLSNYHIVNTVYRLNPKLAEVDLEFFYREYIHAGGKAYAPFSDGINLENAIKLIHQAGGVSGIAHPGEYWGKIKDIDKLIKLSADRGASFLEVPYAYRNDKEKHEAHFGKVANNLNLIQTGGSDFHPFQEGEAIGNPEVPYAHLEQLKARWREVHSLDF